MASHETVCPVCGSALRVDVFAHIGGAIEENVGVTPILSSEEQAAQTLLAAKAEAEAAAAKAQSTAEVAARAVLAAAKSRDAVLAAAGAANAKKTSAAKAALKGGA